MYSFEIVVRYLKCSLVDRQLWLNGKIAWCKDETITIMEQRGAFFLKFQKDWCWVDSNMCFLKPQCLGYDVCEVAFLGLKWLSLPQVVGTKLVRSWNYGFIYLQ